MSEVTYVTIPKSMGYEIGSDGSVRRHRGEGWTHIRPISKNNGYLAVSIVFDTGKQQENIHKLVLNAFHGPAQKGQVGRHLNGMPWDNRRENLAWGTHAENESDKRSHGRSLTGTKNHQNRLNEDEVIEIRRLLSVGTSQTDIGRLFGVSRTAIQWISTGRTWAWFK